MRRWIGQRWLLAICLALPLVAYPGQPALGSGESRWRGFKIVTVINKGIRSELSVVEAAPAALPQPGQGQAVLAPLAGDGVLRVGVIDSGISAVAGLAISGGRNYLTEESYDVDHSGHGTALAAIVARAAPQAELVSLRISAPGKLTTPEVAAAAIRGAVDEFGCDILLMAFGQSDTPVLRQAVEYAASQGVVLIAAVGNEGQTYKREKLYFPAGYQQVIGVGATDPLGNLAVFSQRAGVSFVTCGQGLQTVAADGQARLVTGTSFAAAAVAGLAAELGLERADLFLQHLQSMAIDKGAAGYDIGYGFGLIEIKIGGEAACREN